MRRRIIIYSLRWGTRKVLCCWINWRWKIISFWLKINCIIIWLLIPMRRNIIYSRRRTTRIRIDNCIFIVSLIRNIWINVLRIKLIRRIVWLYSSSRLSLHWYKILIVLIFILILIIILIWRFRDLILFFRWMMGISDLLIRIRFRRFH